MHENISINLNYLQLYSRNLFIELTMLKPAKGLRGNSAAVFRLAPQLDASWVGPLAVLDAPFCVRRLPPQLLALSGPNRLTSKANNLSVDLRGANA